MNRLEFLPVGFLLTVTLAITPPRVSAKDLYEMGPDSDGKVPVGQVWVGVALRLVEDHERPKEGLGREGRLIIDQIVPQSPAAKADIRAGDIVLAIGEQRMEDFSQFLRVVGESEGKTLKLKLAREGKIHIVELKPQKRPAAKPKAEDSNAIEEVKRREEIERQRAEKRLQEARERLSRLLQEEPKKPEPKKSDPKKPESKPIPPAPAKPELKRGADDAFKVFDRYIKEGPPRVKLPGIAAPGVLPADMEVTLRKRGNEPARITVKQGHREWRTIETDLGILPPEAQKYVGGLLVREAPPAKGPTKPTGGAWLPNFLPGKHEAIELELKLGPEGVVESAEARQPKMLFIRPGGAADEKGREAELQRLREEILKLHGELEGARKKWKESLDEFKASPPKK